VAVLLVFAGGTFFLQGVDVLPGSFMTGDRFWAGVGAALFAIGVFGLWVARRPRFL
jgi:hypothetical protein